MSKKITREEVAEGAIWEAVKYLRQSFGMPAEKTDKYDGTFVTPADIKSEEIIVSLYSKHFPEDSIISEELGVRKGTGPYAIVLDPLDGTHNRHYGSWLFSCGLALVKEEEILLGICHLPMLDEFIWASKGRGAFRNGRRIQVLSAKELKGQMCFVEGAFNSLEALETQALVRFRQAGCYVRSPGCLHYSFTRIALGQGIVLATATAKLWDVAPAAPIIEEAGGIVVVVIDGKVYPLREALPIMLKAPDVNYNVLATTKPVYEAALECFLGGPKVIIVVCGLS